MTFSPIGQVRHPTRRDTKGDTGLDTARTLIQSILDQVSTNDSPHIGAFDDNKNNNNINNIYPTSTIQSSTNGSAISDKGGSNTITASTLKRFKSTNSGSSATNTTTWTASQGSSSHLGGSGNGGFGAIPGSSNRVSRQRHILPEPMSMVPPLNSTTVGSTGSTIPQSQQNTNSRKSEMTSATTTNTTDTTTTTTTTEMHQPGTGGEVIMGNLSLAGLCVRTLKSVPGGSNTGIELPRPILLASPQGTRGGARSGRGAILNKSTTNIGNPIHNTKSEQGVSNGEKTPWQMEVEGAPTSFDGRINSYDTVDVQMEQLSLKQEKKNTTSTTTTLLSLSPSSSTVEVVKNLLPSLLKGTSKGDYVDKENKVNGSARSATSGSGGGGGATSGGNPISPEADNVFCSALETSDAKAAVTEMSELLFPDAQDSFDEDDEDELVIPATPTDLAEVCAQLYDHVEEELGPDGENDRRRKTSSNKEDNLSSVLEEEEDLDLSRDEENMRIGTKEAVFEPSFDAAAAAEGLPTPISHIEPLSPEATLPSIQTGKSMAVSAMSSQSQTTKSRPTGGVGASAGKQRMQMFGSEYARHLASESPFSPIVMKSKSRSLKKKSSSKKSSTSFTNPPSYPQPSHHTAVGSSESDHTSVNSHPVSDGIIPRAPSHVSSISGMSMSSTSASRKLSLEETSEDILNAAITDILVTYGNETPPKGYYRITHTSDGVDMESLKQMSSGGVTSLMSGRKGSSVFLNVKKEPKWDRAVQRPCVTALAIIFPDKNEFVPPGFCVVRRQVGGDVEKGKSRSGRENMDTMEDGGSSASHPANLNHGTSGERVYLCYRRSREGNPITGLIPLQPSTNEAVPEGYTVIERSPRNFVADINSKAGPAIFVAFRQRLANLETLRPLPLVLSVNYSTSNVVESKNGETSTEKTMNAYYCTGGTIVPGDVGRFHIMDRSTHPLLSPSSVTNRISLIQASRVKRSSSIPPGQGSNASTASSPSYKQGMETPQTKSRPDRSPSPLTLAKGLIGGSTSKTVPLVPMESFQSNEKSLDTGHSENDSLPSYATEEQNAQHTGSSAAALVENQSMLDDEILRYSSSVDSPFVKETPSSKEKYLGKSLIVGNITESERASASANRGQNNSRTSIFVSNEDTALQSCFDAMRFIPSIECPTLVTLKEEDEMKAKYLLQARIAALTPILTACYTQHGGSAILAVEGLNKLLKNTDFFLPDISKPGDPLTNNRLTLLDLAVQVVCDVSNSTARETNFIPCIEFVSEAMYYSRGNLNARTIGYVLRFYLFIFYFGASVPTSSTWPKTRRDRKNGANDVLGEHDTMLLSEEEFVNNDGYRRGYVPGGAPQAATLALKEFVSIYLSKIVKMSREERNTVLSSASEGEGLGNFIKDFVSSVIDNAIHQVDGANYTQLALHQIHRSGGSELFWHDMMTSCGVGLFASDNSSSDAAKDFFITSFSIMAYVVKVASGKIRRISESSQFVPRDVASKLLSLELLLHFLEQWRKSLKALEPKKNEKNMVKQSPTTSELASFTTMAYSFRRLVVPCLLSNTRSGMEDIRVFRRMMKIITELWITSQFRQCIKIELGVLIEHFILKILRLGPQVLPPRRLSTTSSSLLNEFPLLLSQQISVVTELKLWFQDEPRDILELFLNFDQVDAHSSKKHFRLLPSTHWKLTQQLCDALCALAEQCTEIIGDQIRLTRVDIGGFDSQTDASTPHGSASHTEQDSREMAHVRDGARLLQEKCFDAIGQITRSLMLCAAASSGANNNLLSHLRERKEGGGDDDVVDKQGIKKIQIEIDDASIESDGEMTAKSVSAIGNIVGGIMNKKKDVIDRDQEFEAIPTPRVKRSTQPVSSEENGDGIVEYWQTSIAAERRKLQSPTADKNCNASVDSGNTSSLKKPPRSKRSTKRTLPPSTPPRNSVSSYRSSSPMRSSKTPKKDDSSSIVSFAEDSIKADPQFSQKVEKTLQIAFEIMETKSLKKGLDYLIACNFLTPSPRDIASFLRLHQSKIDPVVLGEYLGDGGKDGDDAEHFNQIRFNYTSAISFVGHNVEQGLRHYLTNCGFRLPGEAQKIDRMMTSFSQCYWEDNAGDHGRCPFTDQDTVFLISFAIIMLNTDLHKTSMFAAPPGQTQPKQKQRKKMTKTEFLNNLRGVDNAEDLSRDYLSDIYDSIAANPIAIYRPPDSISNNGMFHGKKTIRFSTGDFGHIIQGNVDLSSILKHLIKSVKPAQELLRGLAAHEHPYLSIRNRKKKSRRKDVVPQELIRSTFGSIWHHFHGVINTTLDSAHLDPKGLEKCLDVLMYSLCATICLDLTIERNAFASQLVRVKFFRENRGLEEDEETEDPRRSQWTRPSRIRDHLDYKNDPWYLRIEQAAESYHENAKVQALDEVDSMFRKLHASLKVDSTLKKQMIFVARRIRNGQILLNDPTRYFLKEGILAKRCNRTGRNIKYTFFLFSDILIYASTSGNGEYKIHGELPLHLMKIVNLVNTNLKQKRSFHVIHPKKSFLVVATTMEEKENWLEIINSAIAIEVKRKARIEGARQASAAFDR